MKHLEFVPDSFPSGIRPGPVAPDLQELVLDLSTRFINLEQAGIDDGIQAALKAIGTYAGVDRAYILLLDERDPDRANNPYEWCAEGVASVQASLQGFAIADFSLLSEVVLSGRTLAVANLDQIPAEAAAERAELMAQGVQSLLGVPMSFEGEIRGLLGFDAVREAKAWTSQEVTLLQLTSEILMNALARKRARRRIEHLTAFENLVLGLSTRFIGVGAAGIDGEIERALEELARFVGVDRSYVFRVDPDARTLDNTHEWCRAGIEPQIDNLHDVPADAYPWIFSRLIANRVVHIPRVADLPSEAAADRQALEAQDIRSLIAVPMTVRGRVAGVLGFDAVVDERTWSEEEIKLLRVMGEILVNTLERARAEAALIRSEAYNRALIDGLPDFIFRITGDGVYLDARRAKHIPFYRPGSGPVGGSVYDFLPRDIAEARMAAIGEALASGRPQVFEYALTIDGRDYDFEDRIVRLDHDEVLSIVRDVTERTRAEEALRQTQKLESIGVLAGGIAHDFNNLLTGVLGQSSLALDRLPGDHPVRSHLVKVVTAAERAADLTAQLLAYAGGGRVEMKPLDFNRLVRDTLGLLETGIPKKIDLGLRLEAELPFVQADRGQIQQVVMNLVLNGAEAIGSGAGRVSIRTGVCDGAGRDAADYVGGTLPAPGRCVCLEVEDTGAGMSPEVLRRIFDPFFTTKHHGRGLGLSAVLGIVRSHRGGLKVTSEPGRGTRFVLSVPALQTAERSPEVEAGSRPARRATGTVLVIDDEDQVRELARDVLTDAGYRVLDAPGGEAGLALLRKDPGAVNLVLLDMQMPGLNGVETYRELRTVAPDLPVVFSSGYTEAEGIQEAMERGEAAFLPKPYAPSALLSAAGRLLDGIERAA